MPTKPSEGAIFEFAKQMQPTQVLRAFGCTLWPELQAKAGEQLEEAGHHVSMKWKAIALLLWENRQKCGLVHSLHRIIWISLGGTPEIPERSMAESHWPNNLTSSGDNHTRWPELFRGEYPGRYARDDSPVRSEPTGIRTLTQTLASLRRSKTTH
jgi:hypothetical protein